MKKKSNKDGIAPKEEILSPTTEADKVQSPVISTVLMANEGEQQPEEDTNEMDQNKSKEMMDGDQAEEDVNQNTDDLKHEDHLSALIKLFDQIEADLAKANLGSIWLQLDLKGTGKSSLAAINNMVLEKYPSLTSSVALAQAYKLTCVDDGTKEKYVRQSDFKLFMRVLMQLNRVYTAFPEKNDDSIVTLNEFKKNTQLLGFSFMSEQTAERDYAAMDTDELAEVRLRHFIEWFMVKKSISLSALKSPNSPAAAKNNPKSPKYKRSEKNANVVCTVFDPVEKELMEIVDWAPRLNEVWMTLELNADGNAPLREVQSWLISRFKVLNNETAFKRAFSRLVASKRSDAMEDAVVSRKELRGFMKNVLYYNRLYAAFSIMDDNDNQKIDFEEFTTALTSLNLTMTAEDVQAEFDAMDTDGSGLVVFDEFCEWFLVKTGLNPESKAMLGTPKEVLEKSLGVRLKPKVPLHGKVTYRKTYGITSADAAEEYLEKTGTLDAMHFAMCQMVEMGLYRSDINKGPKDPYEVAASAIEFFADSWIAESHCTPLAGVYFKSNRKTEEELKLKLPLSEADNNRNVVIRAFDMVEAQCVQLCDDKRALKELWKSIRVNEAGEVCLRDFDQLVHSRYPLLDNEQALRRAYKRVTGRESSNLDTDAIENAECFGRLLLNLMFFARLSAALGDVSEAGLTVSEFKTGVKNLSLRMPSKSIMQDFEDLRSKTGEVRWAQVAEWYILGKKGLARGYPKKEISEDSRRAREQGELLKLFDSLDLFFLDMLSDKRAVHEFWAALRTRDQYVNLAEVARWLGTKHPILENWTTLKIAYERITMHECGSPSDTWVLQKEVALLLKTLMSYVRLFAAYDVEDDLSKCVPYLDFRRGLKVLGVRLQEIQSAEEYKTMNPPEEGVPFYPDLCEWYLMRRSDKTLPIWKVSLPKSDDALQHKHIPEVKLKFEGVRSRYFAPLVPGLKRKVDFNPSFY